jgi:uncharacterized protein (DUF2164 family)
MIAENQIIEAAYRTFDIHNSFEQNCVELATQFYKQGLLDAADEIIRLREKLKVAEEALQLADQLIAHQYSGSSEAMTALQIAGDEAHEALAKIREE